MAKNAGKKFEEQLSTSCEKEGIFYDRIKDVYIPINVRSMLKKHSIQLTTTKNKYDFYIFGEGKLFALELKSINAKSISITDPKIIKPHQIEYLEKASAYDGVVSGFVFNFRATEENETYFVSIKKFLEYCDIAINGKEYTYKNKVNRSSISVGVCSEIGIKIKNSKKKTNYHYNMKDFIKKFDRREVGENS